MNLKQFALALVLGQDARSKSMNLCLKAEDGQKAVAVVERLPLQAANIIADMKQGSLQLTESNDNEYRYINPKDNYELKMFFPATAQEIAKYSSQEQIFIRETPEMYQKITRPYFGELRAAGKIQWMLNVLDDKREMEHRLVDIKSPNGMGFVILPDYKWVDYTDVNSLYLLTIVRRTDLWTVRDLGAAELPLLMSIRDEIKRQFTAERSPYKFPDGTPVLYDRLRIYFHYLPSFPLLHIHIVLAGSSDMQLGASVGQAILLDDVIENIQNDPEYYRSHKTLTIQVGSEHEIYKRLSACTAE